MKSQIIFLQIRHYYILDTVVYINVVIEIHPRLGNKYNWMQRRKESYLNDLCLQIQSTWILEMY